MRAFQACRGWYDVAHDPTLWHVVDFSELSAYTTDAVVRRLVDQHRPVVTNVSLVGCEVIGNASLQSLAECGNLQDVNLAGAVGVTDEGVRELVKNCRTMLYLNLSCA